MWPWAGFALGMGKADFSIQRLLFSVATWRTTTSMQNSSPSPVASLAPVAVKAFGFSDPRRSRCDSGDHGDFLALCLHSQPLFTHPRGVRIHSHSSPPIPGDQIVFRDFC